MRIGRLPCCLLLGLLGCSSGGGGTLQDAAIDFSIDFSFGDLPPGCPPATGNDKGYGAACTRGGRQCPGGQVCTCDPAVGVTPPADTPCFCTLLALGTDPNRSACDTLPPNTCGQNATCCAYGGVAAICVPNVCLGSAMCPMF